MRRLEHVMKITEFDVVVLGTGAAGLVAALAAGQHAAAQSR